MTAAPHNTTTNTADNLTLTHLPLVGYNLRQLAVRIPHHVEHDDLTAAGYLALVQASRRYDPTTNVPFRRYANHRIQGAMLDELRKLDPLSRATRTLAKRADLTRSTFTSHHHREPTPDELSSLLGVSHTEIETAEAAAKNSVLSLDAFMDGTTDSLDEHLAGDSPTGEDAAVYAERIIYVRAAVQALSERSRFIMNEVFFRDSSVTDIGLALDLTQSRVSQLKAEALASMGEALRHFLGEGVLVKDEELSAILQRRRNEYFARIAAQVEQASVPVRSAPQAAVAVAAAAASRAAQHAQVSAFGRGESPASRDLVVA